MLLQFSLHNFDDCQETLRELSMAICCYWSENFVGMYPINEPEGVPFKSCYQCIRMVVLNYI